MNDRYRPTPRRQRLIIVAVTVATVVTLWMVLLLRPGWHVRTFPDAAKCAKGQTTGCVGGKADVMLIPATPAVSASPATPAASAAK
jgi:hypothetical protein